MGFDFRDSARNDFWVDLVFCLGIKIVKTVLPDYLPCFTFIVSTWAVNSSCSKIYNQSWCK